MQWLVIGLIDGGYEGTSRSSVLKSDDRNGSWLIWFLCISILENRKWHLKISTAKRRFALLHVVSKNSFSKQMKNSHLVPHSI